MMIAEKYCYSESFGSQPHPKSLRSGGRSFQARDFLASLLQKGEGSGMRLTIGPLLLLALLPFQGVAQKATVLTTDQLKKDVAYFNSIDDEAVKNYVTNEQAFAWLSDNIPLFDCPDSVIRTVYNYRW